MDRKAFLSVELLFRFSPIGNCFKLVKQDMPYSLYTEFVRYVVPSTRLFVGEWTGIDGLWTVFAIMESGGRQICCSRAFVARPVGGVICVIGYDITLHSTGE